VTLDSGPQRRSKTVLLGLPTGIANITIFNSRVAVRATSGTVRHIRPTEIDNLVARSHVGESFESRNTQCRRDRFQLNC
jgi:hypothetical protein